MIFLGAGGLVRRNVRYGNGNEIVVFLSLDNHVDIDIVHHTFPLFITWTQVFENASLP
jgi:hypothetical protein